MFSLFDHKSESEPGFNLAKDHHEALLTILNRICHAKPERPLCRISTRLMDELQHDKIIARFVPADSEDGFDFLHLFFPQGPTSKASLQIYAWVDGEDMYCIGIGTEDKTEMAIERIHDHDAYLVGHKLLMEMLTQARAEG